jgi:hypothetical protein
MFVLRFATVTTLLAVLGTVVSARRHDGYNAHVRPGDAIFTEYECEPVGYQFCDPYDPVAFFTCAPEGWVKQPCAPGTVCYPSKDRKWPPTIQCDYPELK